ncbi:hypothetical protein SDC9_202398 [bioreactor metagenome]|uniref:Uncharacterized protein n=1 Tax=bioreactor metagenome TaxID=1076179 RepID=A0A645ITJ7_9ZZZZ
MRVKYLKLVVRSMNIDFSLSPLGDVKKNINPAIKIAMIAINILFILIIFYILPTIWIILSKFFCCWDVTRAYSFS